MEYRFNADEWSGLQPEERIYRCRLMADEAQALASRSVDHMKSLYLQLAVQWKLLADEMDFTGSKPPRKLK